MSRKPVVMAPPPRRWATPKGAAEYGEVTPRTLRNFVRAGKLTAYRLGNRAIRYDLNEIDALLHPVPTVGTDR